MDEVPKTESEKLVSVWTFEGHAVAYLCIQRLKSEKIYAVLLPYNGLQDSTDGQKIELAVHLKDAEKAKRILRDITSIQKPKRGSREKNISLTIATSIFFLLGLLFLTTLDDFVVAIISFVCMLSVIAIILYYNINKK